MSKGISWNCSILIACIIILSFILITGCKDISCETDADCNESEYCYESLGMMPSKYCVERFGWIEPINNSVWNNTYFERQSLNWTFDDNKPDSEDIPSYYKQIKIYETICGCWGFQTCNMSMLPQCSCDEYCYNKSKTMWVEK